MPLLLDRVTVDPLALACERVTVHVVEPRAAIVVGEQLTPVSDGPDAGAVRLMDAD